MTTDKNTRIDSLFLEVMSYLSTNQPFFSSYMYQRQRVITMEEPQNGIDTAATDGKNLFFYMPFLRSLTTRDGKPNIPAMVFVLAHEIMHDVYSHPSIMRKAHDRKVMYSADGLRELDWSPDVFNIAADARINADLVDVGMTRPIGPDGEPIGVMLDWVKPEHTVLEIYEKLMQNQQGEQGGKPGSEGSGQQHDKHLMPQQADTQAEEEARKQAVETAVAHGQLAGKLPQSMKRLLDKLNEPTVDWVTTLKEIIVSIPGYDMLDWHRMARRSFLLTTAVNPRRKSDRTPPIVFVVDTSGSTSAFVQQFVSEVASVAEDLSPKSIHVLWTTTEVAHVDELDDADASDVASLTVHGYGGTDLRAAFDWVGEHMDDEPLAAMVILTDAYTPWPSEAPDYPVITAVTPGGSTTPEWMTRVEIVQ